MDVVVVVVVVDVVVDVVVVDVVDFDVGRVGCPVVEFPGLGLIVMGCLAFDLLWSTNSNLFNRAMLMASKASTSLKGWLVMPLLTCCLFFLEFG